MSGSAGSAFRRLPVRVALITTVIVGVAYVIAALAVVFISRNTLVGNIDERLARQLSAIQARPDALAEAVGGEAADLDNDGDARRFDAPLIVWVQGPLGALYQSDPLASLPAQYATTPGPITASIGGTDMRLVGGPLEGGSAAGWLTLAQSTGEATSAVNTLILAEVLIGPVLVLIVFLGSLLVGRRVATPIEQARLAQLAFTADASHELRTPLTVIAAETALGLQDDTDPAHLRHALVRIQDETQVLRSLVDDLLWLARFDSAPSSPHAEAVDLGTLASATAQRFAPIAAQLGTKIGTDISGPAGPVIKAPPEWVARLISVLVDNAVRHSQPGASVSIKVHGEGNRVQLAVEDDGPGIPADQRDQVLNRFHRASGAHEGAGLGLAIADAIVGATGGQWQIGESGAGGARMAVHWHRLSDPAYANPTVDLDDESPDDDGVSPGPASVRTPRS